MNISCIVVGKEEVICNGTRYMVPEEPINYKDSLFWIYLGVYVFLVLFAGLMSGLTMGLLSLDILSLKVLMRGGKINERKHAKKILPLVEQHHLLLVTLLLANAAAVEAMPIFMDRISSPVIAICVSVTAVLFFGEVVPQALCTRYGLAIGACMAPFVKILIILLFIVAWPISKLLDCLLGNEHSTFFRRAELKELVDLHKEGTDANEEPLRDDEVLIIQGALDMRNKRIRDRYTPLDRTFMLSVDDKLDDSLMLKIIAKGHSRVPVYEGSRENIVGLILVKSLIRLDPKDATLVRGVYRPRDGSLLASHVDEPLFELLDKFQTGKSHMCVVYGKAVGDVIGKRTLGIITLEDVLEQLIQEDIWDETDVRQIRPHVQNQISIARARYKRMKSSEEHGHQHASPTRHVTSEPRPSRGSLDIGRINSPPEDTAGNQPTEGSGGDRQPLLSP
ncbi:DUF21 domain-containing protein At4g33700 isoform X2 [Nematostella vectensis]|uniref:DUF21 domain-containing protein At4g33700 isoform X2 n=1 Tax=Nematostella vectensis TaxID=45351 RepID=UPI00207759FB|nr:DUF21 domain-containing protein At4g33700 isoform X2 [Nematostella vectensis]